MKQRKKPFGKKVAIKTLLPIYFIWVVYALQITGKINYFKLATDPAVGFYTILTAPFLHGNLSHIVGNSIFMLILLPILIRYYNKHYAAVMAFGVLIPPTVMYFLKIPSVGISGLVATLFFFVVFTGMFSKNKTKFLISIGMLSFFGVVFIKGITSLVGNGVAWQAHLSGAVVGLTLALKKLIFKKTN